MAAETSEKNRKKRPGIREIARQAGVSPTTVSFILNGRAKEFYISDATCKRVLEVVRQNNYRQNFHGRAVMQRRTYLVGVIVAQFDSSFTDLIIANINRELQRSGYHMLVSEAGHDREYEAEVFAYMNEFGVDGCISAMSFSTEDLDSFQVPEYWLESPVVSLLHPLNGISSVCTDHAMGVELMLDELWKSGHRKIAYFGHLLPNVQSQQNENFRHFSELYARRGCEAHCYSESEDILNLVRSSKITAVMCHRDHDAAELIKFLQKHQISVPEDVSIAGYGGDKAIRQYVEPQLCTILEAKEELGILAVRQLLKELDDPRSAPVKIKVAPSLLAGKSINRLLPGD